VHKGDRERCRGSFRSQNVKTNLEPKKTSLRKALSCGGEEFGLLDGGFGGVLGTMS
jgi:hypothetical protein